MRANESRPTKSRVAVEQYSFSELEITYNWGMMARTSARRENTVAKSASGNAAREEFGLGGEGRIEMIWRWLVVVPFRRTIVKYWSKCSE